MKAWIEHHRTSAQGFYKRHEKYWPVVFFIGGFLFDLIMLDRIDSAMVIGQQALYIFLLGLMLGQLLREEHRPVQPETKGWLKRQYYHHRLELMHFFFGTLLNAYTIFFFKSSSLIVSFAFLAFLVGLLIVNEMPRFRSQGLPFKYALLALCVYSYCSYVVPVFVGKMGSTLFFFSLLIGYFPFVFAVWWAQRRSRVLFEMMKTTVILPATLVLVVFLGAYFLGVIPPAPLSIRFIGVYHSIQKVSDNYQLGNERPRWKIWQNGDQDFKAQPGDKIYVFFRIFAPTHFSQQVMVAWYRKHPSLGWRQEDRFATNKDIGGGRSEGYRGFGIKSNYDPGQWRVQVETMDGREIGRIYLNVELAPPEARTLTFDTQ